MNEVLRTQPEIPQEEPRAGKEIDRLTRHYADEMNRSEFATEIRERRIQPERYKGYLVRAYPLATDFNRGLIRSMSKFDTPEARRPEVQTLIQELQTFDHVDDSKQVVEVAGRLVKAVMRVIQEQNGGKAERSDYHASDLFLLAAQLYEEQQHNDYFREMMAQNGIDHDSVNRQFQDYIEQHEAELETRTAEALSRLRSGSWPTQKEGCPFPETVIAQAYLLRKYSEDPEVPFIVYNAIQSSIELTLFKVISESIYPGVAGVDGQLSPYTPLIPDYDQEKHGNMDSRDKIPNSIRWWDEHSSYGQHGNVEARHIQEALQRFNEQLSDPAVAADAMRKIDDVLLLFASTLSLS